MMMEQMQVSKGTWGREGDRNPREAKTARRRMSTKERQLLGKEPSELFCSCTSGRRNTGAKGKAVPDEEEAQEHN